MLRDQKNEIWNERSITSEIDFSEEWKWYEENKKFIYGFVLLTFSIFAISPAYASNYIETDNSQGEVRFSYGSEVNKETTKIEFENNKNEYLKLVLEDPSLPKNSPVDLGMLNFSDDASLENIVSEELILSISDKIHYEELQEINNDDEFFQYVLKVAAEVMVESGSQDDLLLDLACDGKLSEANYERIEKIT